jgi:integrase
MLGNNASSLELVNHCAAISFERRFIIKLHIYNVSSHHLEINDGLQRVDLCLTYFHVETTIPKQIIMGNSVMNGIGRQAKTLSEHQQQALLAWLNTRKHADRNRLIVLLSFKSGLRAKEIASLKWSMVMNAEGNIGDHMHLTNDASKGKSGRVIALNKDLKRQLIKIKENEGITIEDAGRSIIQTQREQGTSAQVIVNSFAEWYRKLGFVGCSSHSGRRSFITQAARKIGLVGGSLRDVQALAGHASLVTTSRYIETDVEAQLKLVNMI